MIHNVTIYWDQYYTYIAILLRNCVMQFSLLTQCHWGPFSPAVEEKFICSLSFLKKIFFYLVFKYWKIREKLKSENFLMNRSNRWLESQSFTQSKNNAHCLSSSLKSKQHFWRNLTSPDWLWGNHLQRVWLTTEGPHLKFEGQHCEILKLVRLQFNTFS